MQPDFYDVHNFKVCHAISYDIHMLFYVLPLMQSFLILNDRQMYESAVCDAVFTTSIKYIWI